MDVIKYTGEIIQWPLDRARDIGSFVMMSAGQEHLADRLRRDEPRSRAFTALKSAKRALAKDKPDQDLARFELLRAAIAVESVCDDNPELTQEIGPAIVEAAVELPNTEVNAKIAERVTSAALEGMFPPHPAPETGGEMISIRGIHRLHHR